MGQRERDRLKVLHEVERGHLTQRQGAGQIGMSERGFRKLLARYRVKGDGAVVHALRGRRSNRRVEAKLARRAVRLVEREYADFGPTLAAEYLEREHGIELSRETLRQLMIEAGLWKAQGRQVKTVHVWRERRSCRGELVQWDTSVHAWFEERGPAKMFLVALIDDATSTLFARFVPADSTAENMRVLWAYVERYGRPQSVYTDKASLFQPTLAPGWRSEEPGEKTESQLGRALREMGIEWIAAHSPQAKGRVERSFGTLQDRLVKALRKAGISSLGEANAYLEDVFLPSWNGRFSVEPASEVDAHRPLSGLLDLASILSHVESRQVANDYTVAWDGARWQIPRESVRVGLRGQKIRVERRLDGRVMARVADRHVELTRCETPGRAVIEPVKVRRKRYVPKAGESRWMDGFRVAGDEAWKASRGSATTQPGSDRPPGSLAG